MEVQGGCYCGDLRYRAQGDPLFKGQCHCRECQYISGGSPNVVLVMKDGDFAYTQGSAKIFQREDLDNPVTREFCEKCGTHILSRAALLPGAVMIKVGTFDDPATYGNPEMAIFTADKQCFHTIPEGVAAFEGVPS